MRSPVKCFDDWYQNALMFSLFTHSTTKIIQNIYRITQFKESILKNFNLIVYSAAWLDSFIVLLFTLLNFLIQENLGPCFILEMKLDNSLNMPSHFLLIQLFNTDLGCNYLNFLTTQRNCQLKSAFYGTLILSIIGEMR